MSRAVTASQRMSRQIPESETLHMGFAVALP
jgi:hypothetical protein